MLVSPQRTVSKFAAYWILAVPALFGLLLSSPAYSRSEELQTLAQMNHATWTARDGAPQGIYALDQGLDGTLWIGSQSGLFNFDGRAFTEFRSPQGEPQLPAEPIYSVLVAKDGSLWLGFLKAGAVHIANGRVKPYPEADGVALGWVESLTQAADGAIWGVSQQKRLVRIGTDLVARMEPTPNPGSQFASIMIDSSNTLWLAQAGRLFKRPLAQSNFASTDVETGVVYGFSESRDGSFWMTGYRSDPPRGTLQHIDHLGRQIGALSPTKFAYGVLATPDNSVIVPTNEYGLHRFHAEDWASDAAYQRSPMDSFTHVNGLASDRTRAVFLDADQNIWIGGERGLDRFRRSQLVAFVPERPTSGWFTCADKQGVVWIAGTNGHVYRLSDGKTTKLTTKATVSSFACGNDGAPLMTDTMSVSRVLRNREEYIPGIPVMPLFAIRGLASTSDHTVYADLSNVVGSGYLQYKNRSWTKGESVGLSEKDGWTMFVDSQDRLWLGHSTGEISLPFEKRSFSSGVPGLGIVKAIHETSHGMFAAGNNGLGVFRENRVEMLAFSDGGYARGIVDFVESRNGDLWLNAVHGIVRVTAAEIDAALGRPGYRMKSDLLAEGEFVGAVQDSNSGPKAARGADGKLWFATIGGVMSIDPENWQVASRLPIVSIKSIAVDNRPLAATSAIAPRPQALAISYLGVNLTLPNKIVYKYRLDGFDDTWQEVGHRTEAIYTRLPAGTYTFSVMASNGDGAWTPAVSTAAFTVLPSFYQTTWFAVLSICAALVIVWLAFKIRVGAVTRSVRARAEERADERIKIARELHDTLLQGIQGLLLTLHVATQKISSDDDSKTLLEKALTNADNIIIEGRNRVSSLRSEHLSDPELIASLRNVCNDLKRDDSVQCRVNRTGGVATLHPHVADEIFFVAREAFTNAFRHSQASHISLELDYGKRYFTLVCEDDGCGFGLDEHESERVGHWGLRGMIERVNKLGGKFHCRSTPQEGTAILVSIPAYKAYPHHSRIMFYLRSLASRERNPFTT